MWIYNKLRTLFAGLSLLLLLSCSVVDETAKKSSTSTHIITPSHYYTTPKAKNLSDRYKENLERLVVNIVRNPKTGRLQFANNIVSSGGIGFFTHSATRSPDERYLEIVLGVPEVFDEALDFSSKVDRLFSEYGRELLSVLYSDPVIYKDPDVAGYGLNLSWRSTASAAAGPRIGLERAVLYFSKEEAARFLSGQTSKETVLSVATVFAVQSDGRASRMVLTPLPWGQQVAAVFPEKKSIDTPVESPAILEPQVREKDLPSKEAEATPVTQPGGTKAAAAPRQRTTKEAPPSLPETQAPVVKEAGKRPVPISPPRADRPVAKQKRPEASHQHDQQVASLPGQPKLQDRPPEGLKSEPRPIRETQPQKIEKGEKPEVLVAKPGLTLPAEKAERPQIHSKSELKPPAPERDGPLEKKAEGQRVITPPPDAQAKALQEKSPSERSVKDAGKQPQESIKTEVKPDTQVKSETKAQSADAGKMQKKPASQQPRDPPAADDKRTKTESAREHNESIVLARKKSDPQDAVGYVIQVTFPRKDEADRWSGVLYKQGYRVSMTSAGQEEIVRLRVGAFPSVLQAKAHLEQLEKQGLKNAVVLKVIQ